MKVEFLNPFLVAGIRVLSEELGIKVEMGRPSLVTADMTVYPVNVLVNVVGEVQGIAMYAMDLAVAKKLIKTMTGQALNVMDTLGGSALSELGNIITGLASGALEEAGYRCRISSPTLVMGTGVQVSSFAVPMVVVPISTDLGEIRLYLALSEARS